MFGNNVKLIAAAFVLALLVIGSCKKKDDPAPAAKTKAELITASSWKYSDAGIDLDDNGTKDQSLPAGSLLSCDTDNTLTFTSNNTGVADEGATKCDDADPQSTDFTWSFKNNESLISFSNSIFAGIDGDVKLVELTETKLTMSKSVTAPGIPIPITVIVFLVH